MDYATANKLIHQCALHIRAHMPEDTDDFGDWALKVMPELQGLLLKLDMHGYVLLGGHPNDHHLDEIVVRSPWGTETCVPTRGFNKRSTANERARTTDFFEDLFRAHEGDPLAKIISATIALRASQS